MMMPGHPGPMQHPMHGGPPLQNIPPPAQNAQQQSSNRQSASLVMKSIFFFLTIREFIVFVLITETKLQSEVHPRWTYESCFCSEV